MSLALWTIRILRRLPHTAAFDAHLTNCAALAVIYAPFNGCEPLCLNHIFKRRPLPDFRGPEGAEHDRRRTLTLVGPETLQ